MKRMDKVKMFLGAICSAFFSFFGLLAIPILLLVGCNLIDWFTGLGASYSKGNKITSQKSFLGIVKKISMYVLIFVGYALDMLVVYISTNMNLGINVPPIISCFVAVWLVLNELISITENCEEIGVSIPFLSPIVKMLRGKIEETVKIESEEK